MYYSLFGKKKARNFGFTLIELLVVIAIIALLAAILFPVFGRARENARKSSCQNNLKQLGIGMLQYVQDFDEYFPLSEAGTPAAPYINAAGVSMSWDLLCQPYYKSMQILRCPSDTRSQVYANVPGFGSGIRRSYAIAQYLQEHVQCGGARCPTGRGANMASLGAPSYTVMASERRGCGNGTPGEWYLCGIFDAADKMASSNSFDIAGGNAQSEGIHLGSGNILYADGHVKPVSIRKGAEPALARHPSVAPGPGTWINWDVDLPK